MDDFSETLAKMAFGEDAESEAKDEMMKGFGTWASMVALKLVVAKISKDKEEDPKKFMAEIIELWASQQKKQNDEQTEQLREYSQSGMGMVTRSMLGDPDDISKRADDILDKVTVDLNKFMLDNLDNL